jgi:hypothetical protein
MFTGVVSFWGPDELAKTRREAARYRIRLRQVEDELTRVTAELTMARARLLARGILS